MLNRILMLVTIFLSLIFLIISSNSNANTTFFYSKPNINILDKKTNNISSVNLEEYVIGVVAAEMPASFNNEALKAQAIASRTYAIFKMQNNSKEFDIVTDVSDQSYITVEEMKKKWGNDYQEYYNKIKESVKMTEGMVMLYNNEIVEAYYFAMSNGYTEDVSLVFNEEKDYLKSVQSKYDNSNLKNFEVTEIFTKEEVCNKLEITCNNLIFTNIERSSSNRVNNITVNGIVFKGTSFRQKLSLRSTDFNITEKDNNIFITTKGYGHGVGMSQYGANGMANDGYNYEEILKYYYKNIEISSI